MRLNANASAAHAFAAPAVRSSPTHAPPCLHACVLTKAPAESAVPGKRATPRKRRAACVSMRMPVQRMRPCLRASDHGPCMPLHAALTRRVPGARSTHRLRRPPVHLHAQHAMGSRHARGRAAGANACCWPAAAAAWCMPTCPAQRQGTRSRMPRLPCLASVLRRVSGVLRACKCECRCSACVRAFGRAITAHACPSMLP
jgi:hypothetical protein